MPSSQPQTISISTQTIIKVLAVLFAVFFIRAIGDVVILLFVALVLAAAIDPSITTLERRGVPRGFGIAIIFIGVLTFISIVIVGIVPVVVDQFNQFNKALPDLYQKGLSAFRSIQDPSTVDAIQKAVNSVSATVNQLTKGFFSGVFSFFGGVLSLISVMVLTFYLTMEEKGLKRLAVDLAPAKYRPYLTTLFHRIEERLGQWLRGQLTLGVIIALMTFVGLTILKVKYVVVLSLIAGVTELIPIVGPFIGAIPAVIVGFSISPTLGLSVMVLYLVIQQLENHLIVPRVMAKATGLNPVVVIISILVGGKLAGILGVILAVPTIIIITTFLEDFIEEKKLDENRLEENQL